MAAAGAECGLNMGTPPGQVPTTAPPTPTKGTATPTPTPTKTPTTSTSLVITVAEIPSGIADYERRDWKHWVDEDGDCQDARLEVLIAESLVAVTFETDRECRVETGRW